MHSPQRLKAFSYLRFSTPEQMQGHSLQRQTELAQDYADRHGLALDKELKFQDLGVSAHRGKNVETGALGAFLEAVQSGQVPQGSYLLVESLDRISRQTVRKAARTLEDIVEAGITLVDLLDNGRAYSVESLDNDPLLFLMMALRFMRAHEESAIKSRRVAAAYDKKRKDAAQASPSKPFTRMLPAWLQWDEADRKHVVITERAKIIESIFKKADSGWGQHRIAHWLNKSGVGTWGHGKRKAAYWHRSYVRKILTNPAVIGSFTPHRLLTDAKGSRRRVPLETIEAYWPAVVDQDLFARVSSVALATAARGRHATKEPASIFAGVMKCARCGGAVVRVSKGEHVYLACAKANAKANSCKYQAVRYRDVESAVREGAQAIFDEAPRGHEDDEMAMQFAGMEEHISELSDRAQVIADELVRERSEALRGRLREAEAELAAARDALRTLRARRDVLAAPYVLKRLEVLRDALQRDPFSVAEANRALKQTARSIVLDPEGGTLTIYWHHSETPMEGIPFWSRHAGFEQGNTKRDQKET